MPVSFGSLLLKSRGRDADGLDCLYPRHDDHYLRVLVSLRMIPIMFRAVWIPLGFALLTFLATISLLTYGPPMLWVLTFVIMVIFLADANGRINDLIYLLSLPPRRRFHLYGRYMSTACGRQVMIAVSPRAEQAYYEYGYRWYHILPDKALTKDSPFLNSNFWRQLFSGHRNAK
jgi:hypothetical protein